MGKRIEIECSQEHPCDVCRYVTWVKELGPKEAQKRQKEIERSKKLWKNKIETKDQNTGSQ